MLKVSEPASKSTEMRLLGRKIYFVGASDERAVARIQGSTAALAYVDEVVKIPEPFFTMLLSRLSIEGAQLLATLNPESPLSWFKVKYLDRAHELDLKTWKFTLDDNPSLAQSYIDALKSEYTGHWYARYILGEWAVASGLVYDSYTRENVYEELQNESQYYIAGVDYGTVNPTACVLVGVSNQWPQVRVEKEYYYDGRESRQKTDSELALDIKKFIGWRKLEAFYIDPSAASLKLELQRHDIPTVDAVNDVIPGIKTVHNMFGNKTLVVHKNCEQLDKELQTYAWDTKAAERGLDKPVKKSDHACFVAGTMVATPHGDVPIEKIKIGDRVLTQNGYKDVVAIMSRNTKELYIAQIGEREIVGTGDHPIWTDKGSVALKDLNGYHTICEAVEVGTWLKQKSSNLTEHYTESTQDQKTYPIGRITAATLRKCKKEKATFIGTYGSPIMEKFQKAITFTTRMVTHLIIKLKTWNVFRLRNTENTTQHGPEEKMRCSCTSLASEKAQKSGMPATKVENGIENTEICGGRSKKRECNPTCVTAAVADLKPRPLESTDSAPTPVSQSGDETVDWMMKYASVQCVTKRLRVINTQRKNAVQEPVVVENNGTVKSCETTKKFANYVQKASPLTQRKPDSAPDDVEPDMVRVYNIEVEDEHKYFSNGILAFNCDALRYAMHTHMPDGEVTDYSDYTVSAIKKRIYGSDESLASMLGSSYM